MIATPGLGPLPQGEALIQRSSFGPGAWLLDAQARRDLGLYYAFCRAIDDCADEYAPAAARRHLAAWKRELAALRRGRAATPLGRALAELCLRRGIPVGLMDDLWLGARADAVARVRIRRWRDLRAYCYQVAGSVGIACLPIFGAPLEQATPFALALGEAFQLINILRDAKEDAARGRLYFAVDDLKGHGVDEASFLAGRGGAAARALLADYARRARAALAMADKAAQRLPARPLRTPRMMRALYGGLLDAMETDGLRVFEKRYRLGVLRKGAIVAQGMLGC